MPGGGGDGGSCVASLLARARGRPRDAAGGALLGVHSPVRRAYAPPGLIAAGSGARPAGLIGGWARPAPPPPPAPPRPGPAWAGGRPPRRPSPAPRAPPAAGLSSRDRRPGRRWRRRPGLLRTAAAAARGSLHSHSGRRPVRASASRRAPSLHLFLRGGAGAGARETPAATDPGPAPVRAAPKPRPWGHGNLCAAETNRRNRSSLKGRIKL